MHSVYMYMPCVCVCVRTHAHVEGGWCQYFHVVAPGNVFDGKMPTTWTRTLYIVEANLSAIKWSLKPQIGNQCGVTGSD